jgi:chemotaxis protein MotD
MPKSGAECDGPVDDVAQVEAQHASNPIEPTPARSNPARSNQSGSDQLGSDQLGTNQAAESEAQQADARRVPGLDAAPKSSAPPVHAHGDIRPGGADKPPTEAVQPTTQQNQVENLLNLVPGTTSGTIQTSGTGTEAIQARGTSGDQAAVPVAGLALEIAARFQSGSSRFEIRLDPPELGRVDVRLDVDRHGQVTSRLVVEKAETLDLLRRDAPELERALQQAGLKTGDNGLQFSLRDQAFGGRAQESNGNSARLVVHDPEMAPVETAASGYGRSLSLGTGIDIRV